MKKTARFLVNLVEILTAVFLTILLGHGFQARSLPDLQAVAPRRPRRRQGR